MSRKFPYYIKICITFIGSFLISQFLVNTLFITNTTTPDWASFQSNILDMNQNVGSAGQTIIGNLIASFTPSKINSSSISDTQLPPSPLPTSSNLFGFETIPTKKPVVAQPTNPPFSLPALPFIPTRKPTQKPKVSPVPSPKPNPTSPPKPTIQPIPIVEFPKVSGDPLKQTWYGKKSYACYTQERFIQVYANGVNPDSCRSNVKKAIEAQNTTIKLLGKTITIHEKAYPAFKAVADTLEQYKKDSTHYDFPSKPNYEIKNVGAYVFRCNGNASKSGKYEVCSPDCVLSPHSFGIAVDINYGENCNGCKTYDMPEEIWKTFESYGFRWGGHYPLINSYIDPMHFEYMK